MKAFIKEWGLFSLIIILFILTRVFIWSPVTVDGHSMDPTLRHEERLIMSKLGTINRFDIVVASEVNFSGKEKLIVKRVIGLPGDTIRYENDVLFVNDKQVDEPYLKEYLTAFAKDKLQSEYAYNKRFQILAQSATHFTVDNAQSPNFSVTVPAGEYYLLGDDRLVSLDSRSTGTFSQSDIKGKVIFRFWPLNRIGGL